MSERERGGGELSSKASHHDRHYDDHEDHIEDDYDNHDGDHI